MNETTENSVEAVPVKKVNTNIINGRMPVAVVAQVRFGNNKGDATKDLANMYGTTVGKIDDIKKNRNFAYVTADFRPTVAQKEEGIAWLQRHPKFGAGDCDMIITELETAPEADEATSAAFLAARVAARGQSVATKEGEVANGGGGNRRAKKAKKGAAVEGDDTTADALLA